MIYRLLHWEQATLSQLYEIAFEDSECNPLYKNDALEEMKRRIRNRKLREVKEK